MLCQEFDPAVLKKKANGLCVYVTAGVKACRRLSGYQWVEMGKELAAKFIRVLPTFLFRFALYQHGSLNCWGGTVLCDRGDGTPGGNLQPRR